MDKIRGGYYIVARQEKFSEIAHAPPHVREIWKYLIREANHQGKKKHGEVLERGQILTTYDEIRDDLHWMVGWRKHRYTKSQCETAMKFLRKPGRNGSMITTRKTTRGMIITICNYSYYQDPKNYDNHKENHNDNRNETCDSPQTPDTIDKNGNKDKNKDNPPNPPGGDVEKTWKTDFQIYLTQCRESFKSILSDPKWVFDQSRLNPGVDIRLTMEKAAVNYWSTESAWKRKKKQKITDINWKLTWQNALTSRQNRVYKDAVEKECGTPTPKTYAQCQDAERRLMSQWLDDEREDHGRQTPDPKRITEN